MASSSKCFPSPMAPISFTVITTLSVPALTNRCVQQYPFGQKAADIHKPAGTISNHILNLSIAIFLMMIKQYARQSPLKGRTKKMNPIRTFRFGHDLAVSPEWLAFQRKGNHICQIVY